MKYLILFLSIIICQNFFFGMNKTKYTAPDPAFFDVTKLDPPVGAAQEEEGTCTIRIANTGDVADTQTVTIQWKKGAVVKHTNSPSKYIAGNDYIQFNDSYTFQVGEDGSDWTIVVQTDDDTMVSVSFTVT